MELTVSNGDETGVRSRLKCALIIAPTGTREMIDGVTDDIFGLKFCIDNFALQFGIRQIVEIGMGHGVAADLESLRIQFAHLMSVEVAGSSKESCGEIKGSIEAELAEHGGGSDEIGLAAIVKRNAHVAAGRIAKRLSDVNTSPAGFLELSHLRSKLLNWENVTDVSRIRLAEFSASKLQFVIHQEHNAR